MMQCIICVGDKVFDVFLQMMADKVSSMVSFINGKKYLKHETFFSAVSFNNTGG